MQYENPEEDGTREVTSAPATDADVQSLSEDQDGGVDENTHIARWGSPVMRTFIIASSIVVILGLIGELLQLDAVSLWNTSVLIGIFITILGLAGVAAVIWDEINRMR